ncbi:MAG: type VI secretion system Vgr family protein, partial [Granulosicoccus sp.]
MISQTQDNRRVKIKTSLPDNTLLFSSMSGVDHLSELFDYKVELLSSDHEIDLNELLGRDMTIYLDRPDGAKRYFHGHVCDGAQLNPMGELALYSFTLKPWLWFLTRTADCRIFQDMNVPDILEDIFRGEGFTDFELQLNETYPVRNYCVQYRESDFDFVSRLMEQEGIYYYFRHEDAKHTLVLCDNIVAHNNVSGYESISLHTGILNVLPQQEYFEGLSVRRQVLPGTVVTNDFNFVQPGDNMVASSQGQGSHAHAGYEVYDYSGEYPSADNGVKVRDFGERISRFRMEALQATHELTTLEGEVCGPTAGDLFVLLGAERAELNREYLIVESRFNMAQGGFGHSDDDEIFHFNSRMQVMCAKVQFRAPRKTRRPVMQGPQTAIVVGPAGEEIYTDKHGRVKLQFHWDRYGKSDENSSCWVRVSQVWAGGQYGAIHIPRINHEVIVEFINGDPDQPIVTGRVYNGDNGVPYDLPANATQSGIKSRSSRGGNASNFNEIRMEDKKGEEELYIHAERNHTQVTEADRSESVGNDRSLSVGNDKTETVGANRTLTVEGNKSETIECNKEIKVH